MIRNQKHFCVKFEPPLTSLKKWLYFSLMASSTFDQMIWGRPDGRTPRGSYLAISAHLSDRGAGPHHHVEAARRWCSKSSAQLLPFLTSVQILSRGPTVSVKFLRAPIPRKGSGTTTTTFDQKLKKKVIVNPYAKFEFSNTSGLGVK